MLETIINFILTISPEDYNLILTISPEDAFVQILEERNDGIIVNTVDALPLEKNTVVENTVVENTVVGNAEEMSFGKKCWNFCNENKKPILIICGVITVGVIIYFVDWTAILYTIQASSIRQQGFTFYSMNTLDGANGISTLIPKELANRINEIAINEVQKGLMCNNPTMIFGKACIRYLPGEILNFSAEEMVRWYKAWEYWINTVAGRWEELN